jgi:hypothetical protein
MGGRSVQLRLSPVWGQRFVESRTPTGFSQYNQCESMHCAKTIARIHYHFVRQYLTNFGLGFGCFARHRRKRRASLEKSGLVTPPIRQTLASRILDGKRSPFPIVHAEGDAVRIPEIEFAQIAVQVLLGTVLIDAFHAALEN